LDRLPAGSPENLPDREKFHKGFFLGDGALWRTITFF